MPEMSEIPDTENARVAALSIAWEIVKITYVTSAIKGGGDEKLKQLSNAVIKSFDAIVNLKFIE